MKRRLKTAFSTFMRRLPPSSTLFPYTTLFRSSSSPRRYRVRLGTEVAELQLRTYGGDMFVRRSSATSDRKSTRLNSCHMSISYAVFCLKKKNKKVDAP